jgi:Protein of unknown function (DUF2442)
MITGATLLEVESVFPEAAFVLRIQFSDGLEKKVDLSALLMNPPEAFLSLKKESEFNKVSVNPVGGIQWNCGADLSADYLRGL